MIIVHEKKRKFFSEIVFNIIVNKFRQKQMICSLNLFRVDERT